MEENFFSVVFEYQREKYTVRPIWTKQIQVFGAVNADLLQAKIDDFIKDLKQKFYYVSVRDICRL